MIRRFYVDIDELYRYAQFLSNTINDVNKSILNISRANTQYQTSIQDNISPQVNLHIGKLKKVFNNFSNELNKLTKKVKEDHALFMAYNKKINS